MDPSKCDQEGKVSSAHRILAISNRVAQHMLTVPAATFHDMSPGSRYMYLRFGKPVSDLVIAAVMLVCLSPVILLTALVVRWRLGAPILFLQDRAGKNGQPFSVYKFRSMIDAYDANGQPLLDEVRLTPTGRFLRVASLDELPQLWNVLRGEMSLVGPRPLLVEYLPHYDAQQARRHDVRPGITGWAQVNGRNGLGWEERFELDVDYVERQSVWLDVRILLMTVLKVCMRNGVSGNSQATLEKFRGAAPEESPQPVLLQLGQPSH